MRLPVCDISSIFFTFAELTFNPSAIIALIYLFPMNRFDAAYPGIFILATPS